jgi:intracellular sulfur oxidation DsrE/DsrF family protein
MRSITVLFAAVAVGVVSMGARAADEPDGFWTTPAVQGFGRIHFVPQAAYKPDPHLSYKVVFGMTAAPKGPGDINPSLERVARAVNLYAAAGVPLNHLKFVAIAYAGATELALNDAEYKAKYGVSNPNVPVIAALRKAGFDVAVCAQAVAEHKIAYESIDSSVTLALSALTTITTLEHQGYHLMPL